MLLNKRIKTLGWIILLFYCFSPNSFSSTSKNCLAPSSKINTQTKATFYQSLDFFLFELKSLFTQRYKARNHFMYARCNEKGLEKTVERLAHFPRKGSGIHLGVGGLFNLDIMATRQSKFGILVDINPHNQEMFILLSEILLKSANSSSFIEEFIKMIETKGFRLESYHDYEYSMLRKQLYNPST